MEIEDPGPTMGFDFAAHLLRQQAFSAKTFGPGPRTKGVLDHIAKEMIEVRDSNGDLKEWIDMVILSLDGALRTGATPEMVIAALVAKQDKNEGRAWPDWRTADPDKAIEHDRSGEEPAGSKLLPHQQRVVAEKLELDTKCIALDKFIEGPVFMGLSADEQRLLKYQSDLMSDYSQALGQRILTFKVN